MSQEKLNSLDSLEGNLTEQELALRPKRIAGVTIHQKEAESLDSFEGIPTEQKSKLIHLPGLSRHIMKIAKENNDTELLASVRGSLGQIPETEREEILNEEAWKVGYYRFKFENWRGLLFKLDPAVAELSEFIELVDWVSEITNESIEWLASVSGQEAFRNELIALMKLAQEFRTACIEERGRKRGVKGLFTRQNREEISRLHRELRAKVNDIYEKNKPFEPGEFVEKMQQERREYSI